ncbi:MAG TPA: LysR family transcriptional regulator [Rhodopila sp.]|jgi:DNA-binding transcriptional LysR family regulator|nr:LysR family transcriptional regulator [Rhodopila sp.]
MIDLRSLEIFYWSVRLGGFGRAAEKLHTTQPAVSVRIRQLEDRYNIQLFRRTAGQRSRLTPRGQELYALAERMLELDRDIEAVLTSRVRLRGPLRIGVSETVVRTWLTDLLRTLHRNHPELSPEVSVDISATLRDLLLSGEIDLAILLGPLDLPRVREVALCSYELVWAAHPDLAVPTDLGSLGTLPILTFARPTRPTQAIVEAFAKAGLPAPVLYPNSSLAATIRMALDGIGVCIAPRVAIADELARGALREVTVALAVPPLDFVAAYVEAPQSAHLATVAAIAQHCAGHNAEL